jgi:hypothetical protein
MIIFSISLTSPESIPTFKESRIFKSLDLCEIALDDWHDFYKDNNPTLEVYFTKDENEDKQFLVVEGVEVINYHKCIRAKIHFNKQELLD